MLNAIKFFVGSSQHVFSWIFYKTILLTKRSKFQIYFLEKSFVIKKVIKKLQKLENLKPYFQTSAQEISAISGYFPILKQQ